MDRDWSYNLLSSHQLDICVSSEGRCGGETRTLDTHEGAKLEFVGIVVGSVYRSSSKHKF